jgi:hypothetical protein
VAAEHCEYFRIRAIAVTIITSMGSRSTESESVSFFTSEAEAKEELKKWDERVRKEGEDALVCGSGSHSRSHGSEGILNPLAR